MSTMLLPSSTDLADLGVSDNIGISNPVLPALLRNITSPIRFLAIPDLDLDVDAERDNDPEMDLSISPESLLSWLHSRSFYHPTLHHVRRLPHAPHASHNEALSISSWSSDDDADFQEHPGHYDESDSNTIASGDDPNDDTDDETNDETNYDNIDQDNADDNDNVESDDSGSIDPRSGIEDRAQLAHRLLLSSARQNPTNRNTLIISPDSHSHITGGVPLRRQNAIRVKHNDLSTSRSLGSIATAYHDEFDRLLMSIRSLPTYVGKSPLFHHNPASASIKRKHNIYRWGCLRHLSRRPSLEGSMDRFIHLRRSQKLWSYSGDAKYEKRHVPIHHGHCQLKRKSEEDPVKSHKRRKLKKSPKAKLAALNISSFEGDRIQSWELPSSDKYKILSSLRCSYFRSGSNFSLDSRAAPLLYQDCGKADVNLSFVDHVEKTLHGNLVLNFGEHAAADRQQLQKMITYLCGGERAKYNVNSANRVTQCKAALLKKFLDSMSVGDQPLDGGPMPSTGGGFRIPFNGEIIDFNHCDLRFLPSDRPHSQKPSFSRSIHYSRVRNESIKMQLLEWMKIRPFSYFADTFLLNYIMFAKQNLALFDELPMNEQELSIDFTRHFRELMYDIIRNSAFAGLKAPMITEKMQRSKGVIDERRKQEPKSHLQKASFLIEWETKLSEKMCESITSEESSLLNIQLNYVLFTARVNLSKTIDLVFEQYLPFADSTSRAYYAKKLEDLNKELVPLDANETVLLGSVNRKTGQLELHNTRLYLDYKYAGSYGSRGGSFGPYIDDADVFDSDDEELSSLRHYSLNNSHCKFLEDPYLMENPTVLRGCWKRGSKAELGGGNPRYNFV